jgi:CMP-N-acetylneuraminic acid synthetase
MKSIAIIPARGNSKRVPGKNKRMIGGKPVVLWVMLAALESGVFDEIILTSEDDEILDLAPAGVGVWKRSVELSQDEVNQFIPAVDVCRNMNPTYPDDTAVCMLTACVPTTTAELIQDTGAAFEVEKPDKLQTMKLAEHPHHMALPVDGVNPANGLRRFTETGIGKQTPELPPVYVPAGNLVWASFADFRDESPSLMGGNYSEDTYGYLVPNELAIDIDTPFDFKIAELLLNQRRASSALAYTGVEPD